MLKLSGNSPRIIDTVVGRDLWRLLAQPPAWSQTIANSRLGQMWLCYPNFEDLQRQRLSSLCTTCSSALLRSMWNYVFPAIPPKLQTVTVAFSYTALCSWEEFGSIMFIIACQGIVGNCSISPLTPFCQTKQAQLPQPPFLDVQEVPGHVSRTIIGGPKKPRHCVPILKAAGKCHF